MSRVSLSRRDAEVLATYENTHPFFAAAAKRLRSALAPKPKKVAAKKARTAAKATKRETKAEQTRLIRGMALARAHGMCECGCLGRLVDGDYHGQPEMDHAESRRVQQTIRNVWILRADCHRERTLNQPSAASWLEKWIRHCDRYGYTAEASRAHARLASLADVAAAAALTQEVR